ncbi:type VI secretion system protein TssA [Dyella subtropica]|uniref:type VI secretion system protein TssA n=1 Tax=Dyella subtropica TaxID=2992127 RepID=UPI002253C22F|nr:type VI secretion system protein TssA [Dyella subtropica]
MTIPATSMHQDAAPSTLTMGFDDGGYFELHLGASLARLLAPVDAVNPAGLPVRGNMMYRMVEQARKDDDASLPMGSWTVELKRANWPKVSRLIADLLAGSAKDLQLASWLLEAEIQQRGYAAIAPCIVLMHGLCETCWDSLHPQGDRGDFDARINIVRWVNEKLLRTLSLVPLVGDEDDQFASWSDWELAHHYERLRAVNGELPAEAEDAATLDDLHKLLTAIPLSELRTRMAELDAARVAIEAFEQCLRRQLAQEAPSLSKLDALLGSVQAPIRAELSRRDVRPQPLPDDESGDEEESNGESDFSERDRAYRVLANIADFLARIEPHSPVPYLLRRAVVWGGLDAAALHKELYAKNNGQISVADLFQE